MLVKLKGVHKVKRRLADGSVKEHIYAWRGGPPVKARPGTDAFWQEIADLRRQAETIRPLLLSDLITHFTTGEDGRPNPDFVSLAQTTRDDYEQAFKVIKAKWPRMPAKLTQQRGFKADIRKWHRSFAANPRKADKLLYSLSKVFSYAIKDELIEKNPCAGIDRLYTGSRRDSTWTADLIARFRAMAKPHVLLAFEMAILTGQPPVDPLFTWIPKSRRALSKPDDWLRFSGCMDLPKEHAAMKALEELERIRAEAGKRSRAPQTKADFRMEALL